MNVFKDAKPEDFKIIGEENNNPEPEEQNPVDDTPVAEDKPVTDESPELSPSDDSPISFEDEFKTRTNGAYDSLDAMMGELDKRSKDIESEGSYEFKDDFIKDAVAYYEKMGDLTPYLNAKTVDYTQMTSEKLMRHKLKEEYGELSDNAFEKLYKREVVDKYKLDDDEHDEDDVSLGKELLKVEADKQRSAYIKNQEAFTAPETDSDKQRQAVEQAHQEWAKTIQEDSSTRNIHEHKRLVLGEDKENPFHYEVEPTELVDMAVDNQKFFNLFATENGQVDLGKWYQVAAFAKNPDAFIKALISHGKSQGEERIVEQVKNPQKTNNEKVSTDYDASDFSSGLLKAFADKTNG